MTVQHLRVYGIVKKKKSHCSAPAWGGSQKIGKCEKLRKNCGKIAEICEKLRKIAKNCEIAENCEKLRTSISPPPALAALLFLLGDVFEGYRQQEDPASVPLLTPHAGGGISPSPLWVVHGRPAFSRACAAVHGCSEWAIVLLLPAGPVPDAAECSVPEVVRMSTVPHDPHVAVTLLRDGGAVEQGSVAVYQPSCSTTV